MAFTVDITNQTIVDFINDANSTNETNATAPILPSDYPVDYILQFYGPKRDPLYVVIPITFIYMLIFLTGVVGNISTCIVISKNKSMHTATNYYLFSLAISDFLLLVSGVPQEVYSIWSRYPYVFGEVFCVLRGLMAETAANATVLTITSFTVERYLAICHPFLQHTMSKLSRAVKLIIIVWIVSVSLAVPQALQFGVTTDDNGIDHCMLKRVIVEHSFELSTLLFFLTPMTLITVLYILIGLKLRTSGLMKRENGVSMQRRVHVNSCHRQQPSVGTKRVLKMLVAVVVAFFFCWAPFHAQRLLAFYGNGNDQFFIYAITTYVSGILYYLSTCINPLLYNIMSNKFREAFKETLANFCQLSSRSDNTKRTYRILSRGERGRNGNQESGDYSGSSIRDESVHSTLTQKQSFDSMTLSRGQSFKASPSSAQSKLKSNSKSKSIALSHSPKRNIDQLKKISKKAMNRNIIFEVHTQSQEDALCMSDISQTNDANHVQPTETELQSSKLLPTAPNIDNVKKVQLTITPIQITSRREANSRFKIRTSTPSFFRNWFGWIRRKENLGFYSPTFEHPVQKIKIHLNTYPNSRRSTINAVECTSLDDGEISNSSLKHVDQAALQDELATYMEEIREREKR